MELTYITSEDIINELKNKLSTYFEAGYLDESVLYRKIRHCISVMGGKIRPFKRRMIKIDNYQGALPKDFFKLTRAVGCFNYEIKMTDTTVSRYEDVIVNEVEICKTECDYCKDECGNMYKVVQKFPTYSLDWTQYFNLNLSSDSIGYCEDGFRNVDSMSQVSINKDRLVTNFEKGWVYIEYTAQLEVDGNYLIPDREQIIDWIIDELRVECFEYLFDNGLQDVQNRLANAKQDLTISKLAARAFFKMPEVKDFYNMANMFVRRYQIFKLNDRKSVYSKYY